eukprot:EG_transcript_17535
MSLASVVQGKPCHCCGTFVDLPFTCHKCGESLCEDHRLFASHDCRGHYDKVVPECPLCGQLVPTAHNQDPNHAVSVHMEKGCPREGKTASPQPQRLNFCAFRDCTANEHVLIRCKACGNSFCVPHRLQEDHDCPRLREEQQRRARRLQAQAKKEAVEPAGRVGLLGAQRFANTPQTAIGPTSVASEDRVVFPVYFAPEIAAPPCHMYFSRRWVVGKVVDQVCAQAKLKNENNRVPEEEQYRLFNLKFCVPLPGNATLASLAPELQPGDPLMLARGLDLPPAVAEEVQAALAKGGRTSDGKPGRKGDCTVC